MWIILAIVLALSGAWYYFRRKPPRQPKVQKRPAPLILPVSPVSSVLRPPLSTRAQGHRKSACETHFPITIQGELRKRDEKPFAGRFQWRKRWFVVQNGYLKYFALETDALQSTVPLKVIDLRQIKGVQQTPKGFSFVVMRLGALDRVFSLKTLKTECDRIPHWVSALTPPPSPSLPALPPVPQDTYDPSRVYLSLAPNDLAQLANFQNDATWTNFFSQEQGENDCVTSYKRPVNDQGLMQYLSFGKFPFPAATVYKVMQGDYDYLKVWEKNTLDVKILDKLIMEGGDEQSLIHWIVKWPTFFKNREYLYMRRTRMETEPDGTEVFSIECGVPLCFKTDDLAKLPTSYHPADAVRVFTYEALTVVRSTGPHSCTFTFKCIDDPKVVLPKSLVTWVVDHALPSYMKTMRKAICDYDAYVAQRK